MLIPILTSIFGGSFYSTVSKTIEKYMDNKHEIAMQKLNIEANKEIQAGKLKALEYHNDMQVKTLPYIEDISITTKFAQNVKSLIRPMLILLVSAILLKDDLIKDYIVFLTINGSVVTDRLHQASNILDNSKYMMIIFESMCGFYFGSYIHRKRH